MISDLSFCELSEVSAFHILDESEWYVKSFESSLTAIYIENVFLISIFISIINAMVKACCDCRTGLRTETSFKINRLHVKSECALPICTQATKSFGLLG